MQSHPLSTNALTQSLLCAVGDALAQSCEARLELSSPGKESYNYMRTFRMAAYGLLVAGPMYSLWYRGLDRVFQSIRVSHEPLMTGRLGALFQGALSLSPRLDWLRRLRTAEPAPISPLKLAAGKVAVVDSVGFKP